MVTNWLYVVGTSVLVAGCATTSTPIGEATHGTVLASVMTQPRPGAVPITIRRDQGVMGGICNGGDAETDMNVQPGGADGLPHQLGPKRIDPTAAYSSVTRMIA